jgi:hypothetical protein
LKPSITLAAFVAAGAFAAVAATSPAQAATAANAVQARPRACAFTTDRLVVEFAHSYPGQHQLDQPLSITTKGKKTCVLRGRAKLQLLDRKGKVLPYRFTPGAKGRTTQVAPGKQAVFDLTFATGDGHHTRPARIRVTLPNGGGTRVIRWDSATPAAKTIKVDGFRPWAD